MMKMSWTSFMILLAFSFMSSLMSCSGGDNMSGCFFGIGPD